VSRRGTVLVLGWDDRSFLAAVRSLGRRGLAVHVAWCPPDAVARRSRYVAAAHELPPYAPGNRAWLDALVALCRRERFDLVLPTNDPTVLALQRHRRELEAISRVYVLPDAAAEVSFDKVACQTLARSLGIPVSPMVVVPLPARPHDVLRHLRLPVVIKPRTSYRPGDLAQRRPVRVAHTADELACHLEEFAGQSDVLVEEFFHGIGGGVDVLADRGEVLFTFQHLRLHEGVGYLGAPYRVTAPVDPTMEAAARTFVRSLQYTGVAMFEFLRNPEGAWVMIDWNARFWAALPLTIAAGADFPWYLYQLLVEGRRTFPPGYRVGLYGRNWSRDVLWLREQLSGPRAPAGVLLREAARILTLRERNDTLLLDDPLPGLVDLARLGRRLLRTITTRRAGRTSATATARRDGDPG
jgi:predicted ATP-grasp superfamily ATP-dependent carboligase